MALSAKLEEKLNKVYEPSRRIDDHFNGKDITFITTERGEPVTLFIGERRSDGAITGERYVRVIKRQADGVSVQSSHWDRKGKVARDR